MGKAGRADAADQQNGQQKQRPAQPRRVQDVQRALLRTLRDSCSPRLEAQCIGVAPNEEKDEHSRCRAERGCPQKRAVNAAGFCNGGKQRRKHDGRQSGSGGADPDGQPGMRPEPAAHQDRRRYHRAERIADARDGSGKIIGREALCRRKQQEADAGQHSCQRAAGAVAEPPVIPANEKI